MKTKIAIADDHKLVVAGLQHLLEDTAGIEVTGTYNNGRELLAGIAISLPHVLLLDIHMPGQTGDELAEIIGRKYPEVKIIAVTNQDNIHYLRTMLKKGVKGYVLKTAPEETLLQAISSVMAGDIFTDPALKDLLDADAANAKRHQSSMPVLTRREKEVLQYLTKNLTSQQIADDMGISKKTVESHRQSLLIKLDVNNAAALIIKSIQLGLID